MDLGWNGHRVVGDRKEDRKGAKREEPKLGKYGNWRQKGRQKERQKGGTQNRELR